MFVRQKDPLIAALDDKSLLNLRATNKRIRDVLKKYLTELYTSKTRFVVAMSGQYEVKKGFQKVLELMKVDDSLSRFDTSFLLNKIHVFYQNAAYSCYLDTMQSKSRLPCMLYRLTEYSDIECTQAWNNFLRGEDIIANGRRFQPSGFHCWSINRVWLLAQVHKGRNAVLFSPVSDHTIFRQPAHQRINGVKQYSAFIREAAALIKVGYIPLRNVDGNITLVTTDNFHREDVTYDQLEPTDHDVEVAVRMIKRQ